jgi:hypothetical protein
LSKIHPWQIKKTKIALLGSDYSREMEDRRKREAKESFKKKRIMVKLWDIVPRQGYSCLGSAYFANLIVIPREMCH